MTKFDLPLSFAQQRLWFLDQLVQGTALYNIPAAYRISGPLDVSVLRKALGHLFNRHEALRTTFPSASGTPVQRIDEAGPLGLEIFDLSHRQPKAREAEAQRIVSHEARRPFDLAVGPLLRAYLLRLDEQDHMLLVCVHHIVFDGWSLAIFMEELREIYTSLVSGRESSLPPLAVQYADFALWQRDWLKDRRLDAQLGYWKGKLDKAPASLELPTDHPRAPMPTHRGEIYRFSLPAPISVALQQLTRRLDATLFMVLLAAFKVMLVRYCRQSDIVVGSPIAGRNRAEIENLVGLFVNTLVLRTDLSGDPTFGEVVTRVRETCLAAYGHQDLPFEKLVEELAPNRHLSRHPLFQVMFALQQSGHSHVGLGDLNLTPIEVHTGVSKFDLSLTFSETERGLWGGIEYSTDLFEPQTIERMAGHLAVLIDAAADDPNRRISELPILTDSERHQLVVEWNQTAADYPRDRCVHELFEQQVERTPDRVAVVFEDQQLVYSELNRRANRLAHYLRAHGVGTKTLVGICVERGIDMVVGLLAILKAGGAYVPLDPDYPRERLGFMLEDTSAPVLITQSGLQDRLPPYAGTIVRLDADWPKIEAHPDHNSQPTATSRNLAYVIYTSGSTGKPKGVMIEHRSIVNLIHWHLATHELQVDDRMTMLTSMSFDASVWELWPTLAAGAALVIGWLERASSSEEIVTWLLSQEATISFVPTPLAEGLLEGESSVHALRALLVGGDRLRRYPPPNVFDVVNHFGLTEATVVSTFAPVVGPRRGSPPIGRPISNTQIYILDPHLNPVPVGVPGEIFIGGDGLARGYLNRPELSNERFIANPFSDDPDSRLYRTGDLASYRPDANIEFLGRIDHQVKIRGFRVELGEVGANLLDHPAVRAAVVTAREDLPGDCRLVAYVVGEQSAAPAPGRLRSFLKNKLPDYMVPSVFVELDDLPLTPNGKVDRAALPAPEGVRPDLEREYVAPRTPAEELLASIWAELLRLDRVGIYDNFFDLGGHSLLAVKLAVRMKRDFGVDLKLSKIFEFQEVSALAQEMERERKDQTTMAGGPGDDHDRRSG